MLHGGYFNKEHFKTEFNKKYTQVSKNSIERQMKKWAKKEKVENELF